MYNILKIIICIMAVIAFVFTLYGLVNWISTLIKKRDDKKSRKRYATIFVASYVVLGLCFAGYFAVAVRQYSIKMNELPRFEVTSDECRNGVWDDIITNTSQGKNMSPSLYWESVDGASQYAIVMIDEDADWLHWIVTGIKETNVPCGYNLGDVYGEYVGPYPPSGTHTYTIYVFAMKYDCMNIDCNFDGGHNDIDSILSDLNTSQYTDYNNVIAVGIISGTYTKK